MPNSHTPAFFVAQAYCRAGGAFPFLGNLALDMSGLTTYTPTAQEAAMGTYHITGTPPGDFNVVVPLTEGQYNCIINDTSHNATIIGTSGTGAVVPANSKAIVGCNGTEWDVVSAGGTLTLVGDVTGPSNANTVVMAHVPAGSIPQLGSGNDSFSPDGTNAFTERQGNWVALGADGPINILPAALTAVAANNVASVTCEIHITKDGDTTAAGSGFWRRTVFLRNTAGTLAVPTGPNQDTDISIPNNLGANVSGTGVASKIDFSTNPLTITVSRPNGIPCHARLVLLDYARGWSGV